MLNARHLAVYTYTDAVCCPNYIELCAKLHPYLVYSSIQDGQLGLGGYYREVTLYENNYYVKIMYNICRQW